MSVLQAILIGIVQGLTEFIPVSSTAHMTIAGSAMNLINDAHPEQWTAFIATIQLGTLVAVLFYFRQDIISIVTEFFTNNVRDKKRITEQSEASRMGWYVLVGSLPIMSIGFVFKKIIEGVLTKDLFVIATMLIAVSLLMFIAERVAKLRREQSDIQWKDAIVVGMAQVLALLPGASRSGTTISAGLLLGFTRESAARFSFLLSIPAVAASGVYEFSKSYKYLNTHDALSLTVATIVAGVVGYWSIHFLLRYLRSHSTLVFIIYRVVLGAALIAGLKLYY